MAVDDIFTVNLDQTVHNVVIANVFTYKQTVEGTGSLSANEQLAEAIHDVNLPNMAAELSDDWEAFCIRTQRIAPTLNSQFALLPTANNIGTNGTAGLPANQVAVGTLYSDEFNKLGRGRKFWSGLDESKEFANNLTNDGLQNVQQMTGLLTLPLVHAASGATFLCGNWDSIGLTFYHFQKFEARSVLRKLRSRTTKVCRAS